MKKSICVLLTIILTAGVFTGCIKANNISPESGTDISSDNANSENTNITRDESLLLDANVLSGYLSLCLNHKSTPDAPEFNFLNFLFRCAIESQTDFCYYQLFPRVSEADDRNCFEYDKVKKVLWQVFGDASWADSIFYDEDSLGGWNHITDGDKIYMYTETSWLLSYHAGEYIYSEFSADGKQVISHIELFAPDTSSGDPGSKSIGNYNVVFDVVAENDETFLRFNRFEKAINTHSLNGEPTGSETDFDNSEVIADIKSAYNSNPYSGAEELQILLHSKGGYTLRVWRVYDESDTDMYWLVCRLKDDRLIGFLRIQLSGLNDFYQNRSEKDFEFFSDDDLSLVKIRSKNHPTVFSFEFYSNNFSTQDYSNSIQPAEPAEYVENEIQRFYTTVDAVSGSIDKELAAEYEDLIYQYVNSGTIELNPHYSLNKKYKNYYTVQVVNCYEDDSNLLINYIMRCPETSLGLVQTTRFTKENGSLVYSESSPATVYTHVQNKDDGLRLYQGGNFVRGFEQEMFLYNTKTKTSQNLGLVHDTSATFDYGFMSNGDAYIMNYEEFRTYAIKNNTAVQSFTTSINFPAGGVIKEDGTKRYLFAIRRDPVKFDYIVVYGEYIEDEDYYIAHPNNFQMAYNYKVGLLDKNGNLTQSWDTGVPIMFNSFGFNEVSMFKSSENEIEFFTTFKGYEGIRGRFNIATGIYTPIKEFKLSQ